MANDLTPFFNNMAGAFQEANRVLKPQAAFLTGDNGMPIIYNEVRSEPMARYKKVTLQVPNTPGDAVNAITTKPTAANLSAEPTEIQLDFMPAWGFEISSLEELTVMSWSQVRAAYVDEALGKITRAGNKRIADIFTPTNFSLAGNVSGAAGKGVTLDDFTTMFGVLGNRDVPVEDEGNLFFVGNTKTYTGLLKDPEWREAAKVGDARATNQIRSGVLPLTYGAIPLRDNQMPNDGAQTPKDLSVYFHRNAAALVTAPLPAPEATVQYSYETFGPLTILIAVRYVPDQPRHELWFHALMGVKAWRKTHAVIHTAG